MSNITNLQSANDVDTIIHQQGWNLQSYLSILCDFITLSGLWPQVLTYCQERAEEENNQE